MQIIGGASQDVNILQSNAGAFRNEDFVANQGSSYGWGQWVGGTASNYTLIQLLNPASSGVVILLDQISFGVGGAANVSFRDYGTALANFSDEWKATKLGSAEGKADIYYENRASFLGNRIARYVLDALTPFTVDYKYPLVIEEGQGIVVTTETLNTDMSVTFKGREV